MLTADRVVEMKDVAVEVVCNRFSGDGWSAGPMNVPLEKEITVYVNLRELVTILCSPTKLNFLVLGFLRSEGIIRDMNDVLMMRVCDEESEVDVRLTNPDFQLPAKRRLTSGCGGGATFTMQAQKVESDLVVTPAEILARMKQLQGHIERLSGGMHASALADPKELLLVTEDIGRHNTLDKIQGGCLLKGLSTRDRMVLTTGRISSEMLLKAARMQVPVLASRHSPTESAVALARDLGIALVGRATVSRMTVYTHPERLGCPTE
ncbi:MAG: formate dehydrogenase accessory protein [Syntrophorhabdaceae bacterium PtaU1.Bin034]|nr:MAG: formate dehydrogenase accessory protein [Syntrophorhabdaceae bacterium PtaU1.Bin034]